MWEYFLTLQQCHSLRIIWYVGGGNGDFHALEARVFLFLGLSIYRGREPELFADRMFLLLHQASCLFFSPFHMEMITTDYSQRQLNFETVCTNIFFFNFYSTLVWFHRLFWNSSLGVFLPPFTVCSTETKTNWMVWQKGSLQQWSKYIQGHLCCAVCTFGKAYW